jgi:hypothetical protein
MAVVAGRRSGAVTTLGAGFDVTGEFSLASVRADPTRLARALISMDLSGTFLAVWVHSHPGKGPGCTNPSMIDLDQQRDWARDYSDDLLNAIFVEDGWFRFWGPAVESGRIQIRLEGPGVIKEESDEHLYRLAQ